MGHRSVTHMVKCKAAGRFDGVVKCLSVECAMKKTVFNSFRRSAAFTRRIVYYVSINKILIQIAIVKT